MQVYHTLRCPAHDAVFGGCDLADLTMLASFVRLALLLWAVSRELLAVSDRAGNDSTRQLVNVAIISHIGTPQ